MKEATEGERSPLNKSKTGQFDNNDERVSNVNKKAKPPVLRKTSTMTRSPKKNQNIVSGRNQGKHLATDQEQHSNDYGYTSPGTSNAIKGLNQHKFKIGQGSVEISEVLPQNNNNARRRGTPDSRSYSL